MSSSSSSSSSLLSPDTLHPYQPPKWAKETLANPPKHGRLHLANLPTPLYQIKPLSKSATNTNNDNNNNNNNTTTGILARLAEWNIKLYVKRDDATGGTELGGNKVRKLEFLLADALASECDSVVTIGGEQSNHCRATAAASRMVGLSPHLILRTRRADAIHDKKDDIGWVGNILFDRMVGSTIYTCTPGEYGRLGSQKLVEDVCNHIHSNNNNDNNNPYPIPVGGSNALGTWGYINAVDELMQQIETIQEEEKDFALDHVVFATGSGGTATGISVGLSLAYASLSNNNNNDDGLGQSPSPPPRVHAIGVCDNPDYFYNSMSSIADNMGLANLPTPDTTTEQFVRNAVTVHHGKGRGYAISTDDELDFILQFAMETGIVLDPVYSGKALYYFLKKVVGDGGEEYRDANILFWHTGGSIGLYEKGNELRERLDVASRVKRMDVYGKMGTAGDGGGGDDVVPI